MQKVMLRKCFGAGVLASCLTVAVTLVQPVLAADAGSLRESSSAAAANARDAGAQEMRVQAKKMSKKNWYKKVMKKRKGSYKVRCWNYGYSYRYKKIRTKLSEYDYYNVADVNGDGTSELLLSTSSTGRGFKSRVLVLTFRKGKVKPLMAFEELRNGLFLRDGKLYAQVGGSTESIITGYKINKGKAKQFVKLERLRRWPDGSRYAVTTYWKNGKQISEAQYNAECQKTVAYQTLLLWPKMIVCLGRVAAQRIIRPDFRITREHGSFLLRKGVWLTAVYHPSAILRDDTKYPETVVDFRAIKERLM